jgi:hypothetical protein
MVSALEGSKAETKTSRTWLPHVACQIERGFEAALGLTYSGSRSIGYVESPIRQQADDAASFIISVVAEEG